MVFLDVDQLGGSERPSCLSAGRPDEFVKKIAQYVCGPAHFCRNYVITFTKEKST
jgi:hypothetical protein